MAAMVMLPTPAPAFEPARMKSADEYRRELMIDYAFKAFRYVITPQEADEVVEEGLWEDVDDFVQYMCDANFGEPVPDTANVTLPGTMRIYSSKELDLMDAGLFVGDEDEDEDEDWEVEKDLASDASAIVPEHDDDDEVEEEEDKDILPPYTADIPPSYVSLSSLDPPTYAPSEAIEAAEEEHEIAPVIEPAPAVEITPVMEAEDIVASETETVCVPRKERRGVLSTLGSRLDRKILATRRRVVRGFKAISPRRLFRRACSVQSAEVGR